MDWKTKIAKNYAVLESQIQDACLQAKRPRDSVKLIWVSKTNPIEAVEAATEVGIEAGLTQVDFGENKIQECVEKFSQVHPQRTLHVIGPIQSNKLRKAIQCGQWIHTIASHKHLKACERIAQEEGKQVRILFQVNTSLETSKSGLEPSEVVSFLESLPVSQHLIYSGLMTIGPNTGVPEDGRPGFQQLATWRDQFYQSDERFQEFRELSMGMTNDLSIAIEEGATLIRIGTALFGARDYTTAP